MIRYAMRSAHKKMALAFLNSQNESIEGELLLAGSMLLKSVP